MHEGDAIHVVFIGGHGHSGSTLTSRTLGAISGFCSVGELSYLWTRGLLRDEPCGCGARFSECDFWHGVGMAAFGGWNHVDVTDILNLRSTVARMRHLPLLVAPRLAPGFRRRLEHYTEILGRVYRGIRDISGCDTIIDSSKYPAAAYPLRHVPGIEVRVIHLVRSSHGVCCSFLKKIPSSGGRLMSPQRVASEWTVFNSSIELLGLLGVPVMRLRYEDFVGSPREHTSRVLDFLGRKWTPEELAFLGRQTVDLPWDHSVAGNPMRMRTGKEELRVDERWRVSLPARERLIVTTLTAPGLLRYGYAHLDPRRLCGAHRLHHEDPLRHDESHDRR